MWKRIERRRGKVKSCKDGGRERTKKMENRQARRRTWKRTVEEVEEVEEGDD